MAETEEKIEQEAEVQTDPENNEQDNVSQSKLDVDLRLLPFQMCQLNPYLQR